MLADQVHLLIQSLYTFHISSGVIRQFHLLATADTLGSPVEIAHIDRAANFAGDGVEASLPPLDRLAGSFRSQCKMYDVLFLHLSDDAENDVATSFPINRNPSQFSEQPSQRTPEKFTFDHAIRFSAY